MELSVLTFHHLEGNIQLNSIVSTYAEVWKQSDFPVSEEKIKGFRAVLKRQSKRQGFKLCIVVGADGKIQGYAYGYVGRPSQWWYDIVSADLTEPEKEEWMSDYFEFVELGVLKQFRNMGLGKQLHDSLLSGSTSRTALLSTQVANSNAISLYRKSGWEVIRKQFQFPGADTPFAIMGIKLVRN